MELWDKTAHELLKQLREKEVRATDIVASVFERIREVEGKLPTTDKYLPNSPELKDDANVREQARQELSQNKVQSYISLREDEAMSEAEETDRKLERGKPIRALEGIPLAIKDIFCVKDTASTAASKILETFIAPYDATSVELLRNAGVIIVGKTNLDEFTHGSSTESSAFQPSTRNPWDTLRVPGGSSGGSAAAVAAGETIIALGTDTAGSIRQPAAFCGVVGVKPTYGRVSRYGLIAFASSLDCVGPLTKDVRDAALMLQVMAGYDRKDGTSVTTPVPDFTRVLGKSIKGMRIGWPQQYFQIEFPNEDTGEIEFREVEHEVYESLQAAANVFRDAGAEIVELELPFTRFGVPCYFVNSRIETMSNLHRYDGVKYGYRAIGASSLHEMYNKTRHSLGAQPIQRILMGMYVTSSLYWKSDALNPYLRSKGDEEIIHRSPKDEEYYFQKLAMQVRARIRRDFVQAFEKVDCLMAPTAPFTAFPLQRAAMHMPEKLKGEGGVFGDTVLMQYGDCLTVPADHAGIPAISVPCGFDSKGLPVGLQILCRDWDEETMFRVAYAYEQATNWRTQRRPNLSSPA